MYARCAFLLLATRIGQTGQGRRLYRFFPVVAVYLLKDRLVADLADRDNSQFRAVWSGGDFCEQFGIGLCLIGAGIAMTVVVGCAFPGACARGHVGRLG